MCLQPQPGEKRRLESLANTLQLLQQQLLPALLAAGGWQPDQVQLLGFSQGGTAALELARRCKSSQRLGG
jgi:surfactin synthase thioesterase subunit